MIRRAARLAAITGRTLWQGAPGARLLVIAIALILAVGAAGSIVGSLASAALGLGCFVVIYSLLIRGR